MSWLWRWIVSVLVWLSADHERIATEPARAAAAVAVARASIIDEMAAKPLPPAPPAPACRCSSTCVRGVWRPDGRIEARCDCTCPRCVAERAKGMTSGTCSSGTCPPR
jgi:hypothetical protein